MIVNDYLWWWRYDYGRWRWPIFIYADLCRLSWYWWYSEHNQSQNHIRSLSRILTVAVSNCVGLKPESIAISLRVKDSVASTIWSSTIWTLPYCVVPLISPALKNTVDRMTLEKSSGDSAEPSSVENLWNRSGNRQYYC